MINYYLENSNKKQEKGFFFNFMFGMKTESIVLKNILRSCLYKFSRNSKLKHFRFIYFSQDGIKKIKCLQVFKLNI